MATIKGTKNPTPSTKGSVGDTYLNTETNTYFKCIMAYETIENNYYYWVKKSNGNSGGNISQEEIDKILKQLPTKVSDLTNDSMVSFAEQELTDDQKQQALDNIGTARYQKCELTYNNKPITIYLKDGSITRPLDDASDEVKTVWSTFVQKINTTLIVGNMPWRFRKSILSAFLNANLNGIIPDIFSYYGDAYYKKLIVFSRYKDNSGKYIASYTYDNKGVYARIAQYVDTGEYLSDVTSTKTEEPIMAHGTYQVDDDSMSVSQFNLSSDPTLDMQVATKQYVDKNTYYRVNITQEEKDDTITYKTDKTYDEITTALTENKIVIVNYKNQSLFYSNADVTENTHIFCNNELIVKIASDEITIYEIPVSFVVTASCTNNTITVDSTDMTKMHMYARLYGVLPDVLLTVITDASSRGHDVLLSPASQYDFNSKSVTYYWDTLTIRTENNSINDKTKIYCRLRYDGIINTFVEYSETEIPNIQIDTISDTSNYSRVYRDASGHLYSLVDCNISYFNTMDKVSNQKTANGKIAVVYAKGSSGIDVAYPAVVFSTQTQSYGNFDGWIIDANGNHYSCTIKSGGVVLGSKTTSGMPQPTENDTNKVLYGDMTWKTIRVTAPFYIDSTSSDYSTSNASYGDQIKEALLSGCPVWYYGQETESGKTVSKYTQVTWFNIQQTDTEAKLIIGVGARSDGDVGGVAFTISVD